MLATSILLAIIHSSAEIMENICGKPLLMSLVLLRFRNLSYTCSLGNMYTCITTDIFHMCINFILLKVVAIL